MMQIPPVESPDDDFKPLLGELIKGGGTRNVHKMVGRDDLVIKESKRSNRANWTEYLIFDAVEKKGILGRVESISVSGRFLVMEYLRDTEKKGVPPRPIWSTDAKSSAFGVDARGTVKLRDYGEAALGRVVTSAPGFKPTGEYSSLDGIGLE